MLALGQEGKCGLFYRGRYLGKKFLLEMTNMDRSQEQPERMKDGTVNSGEPGLNFLKNTTKRSRMREEENVEASRQYCIRNKDIRRDYQRRYQSRNRPAILDNQMQYRFRNVEKIEYESNQQYRLRRTGPKQRDKIRIENRCTISSRSDSSGHNISWKSSEVVRDYFESIAKDLQIGNFVDWYRISRHQIDTLQGTCLTL